MNCETMKLYMINGLYYVLARDYGHAETIFIRVSEDAIKSIDLISENVIIEVKK